MKVFVYYNLHKHCWSIKALEGNNKGRVIDHVDVVTLHDPIFKVSEAGRQRVINERRKNVHAGVVGQLTADNINPSQNSIHVSYNPYFAGFFYDRESKTPVETKVGDVAILHDRQVTLNRV